MDDQNDAIPQYIDKNGHRWLQIYMKSAKWCGICEKIIQGKTKIEQDCYQCLYCKLITHRACWTEKMSTCTKSPTATTTSKFSFFNSRSSSSQTNTSPTSAAAMTSANVESKPFSISSSNSTKKRENKKKQKHAEKSKLKQINQYEILCELGRGACGKVYLVQDVEAEDENNKYAMKSFPPIKMQQRNLSRGRNNLVTSQETIIRREIAILRRLIHPNLIFLKDVIEEQLPKGFNLYLILEYVDGGVLLKTELNEENPSISPTFIAPKRRKGIYSEKEASRFFSQILSGLEYLHFNCIAHRDLKPDNILLSSKGVIKLTDFGGSTDFSSASTVSTRNGYVCDTQGTWAFWAPEICSSDDQATYSAFISDIWAAGIVLYVMLYGVLPFWHEDMGELFHLIESRLTNPELELPIPQDKMSMRSNEAREMVESVLIGDPSKRPTIQLCQSHPWIQSNASTDLKFDYRSQLMRHASYQKSIVDLTDDDLGLESAITPGKAVYISKLLFKKLIKSSAESFHKIAAAIASMDDNDEVSEEEDDEPSRSKLNKPRSFVDLLRVFSSSKDPDTFDIPPQTSDLVHAKNPLKSEDDLDEIQCEITLDCHRDSDSDSDSSSSSDDRNIWTWDIFDAPQEFLRRFTDPPPPTLVQTSSTSSIASADMFSFHRNSHSWSLHHVRLPISCHYCEKMIWMFTSENIFQCKLCSKIYHQSCCYEEEEEICPQAQTQGYGHGHGMGGRMT